MQGWIKQLILIREREREPEYERDNESDPADRNDSRFNFLVPVSSVWSSRINRFLSDAERNELHYVLCVHGIVRRSV